MIDPSDSPMIQGSTTSTSASRPGDCDVSVMKGKPSPDCSLGNQHNPQGGLADAARATNTTSFNARAAANPETILARLRHYSTTDHAGCRAPHELIDEAITAIEMLLDWQAEAIEELARQERPPWD